MEVNTEQYQKYLNSDKWSSIAKQRLEIDKYTCRMCGSQGTMTNPLEVHHLSYKHLYHEESRIYEDLVTLCHDCHKNVHSVMNRVTSPQGRKGWKDADYIPKISVFTIAGKTMESRVLANEK